MRQLTIKTLNLKTQKYEPSTYTQLSPIWLGESLTAFFDQKDGLDSRFLKLTGWSLDWQRKQPVSVMRGQLDSTSPLSRIIIWSEGGQLWFSDITGNYSGYLPSLTISNPSHLPLALQQVLLQGGTRRKTFNY